MSFTDLEKAYGRVLYKLLWECLEKKEISVAYIRAIKDMYGGVISAIFA